MKDKKVSIVVVVPIYYEESVAGECYRRLINVLENIAQADKNVKIISFSRNFGHQCAVTADFKPKL